MIKRWIIYGIFLAALLAAISPTNACFSPFNMTVPRPKMSIIEVKDNILFVGGGPLASQPIVDIYNAKTNTWRPQIQLPDLKLDHFTGAVVDSKAIFIGSYNNETDALFVYDIDTEELWGIPASHNFTVVPDWEDGWRSITVGNKAYFYNSNRVVIVDVYANTSLTIRSQAGQYPKATTNGTHLIFVGYQLNFFDLETFQWTRESIFGSYRAVGLFYRNDARRTLIVVESNQLNIYSLDSLNSHSIITIKEAVYLADMIGNVIYLVGPTGVSVVYLSDETTDYASGRLSSVFYQLGSTDVHAYRSLVYKGSIYYTSGWPAVYRMDLQWLFLPMDLQVNNATDAGLAVSVNGYYVYFNTKTSSIHYYKLSTGQLGVIGQRNFPSTFIYESSAVVGNKLVVPRYPEYDVFDSESGTWNTSTLPYDVTNTYSTAKNDKYAAFYNTADPDYFYLFNVERNNWIKIEEKINGSYVYIVEDKLVAVTAQGQLNIYDILTQQWRSPILDPIPLVVATQYQTSVVIVSVADSTTTLLMYNVTADSTSYYLGAIGKPGNEVETYGDLIVFAYPADNDETKTIRVATFNVKSSTWKTVDLPPNYLNDAIMKIDNNIAYVARDDRVETVDLTTLAVSTISVPIDRPIGIRFIGNKVGFISFHPGVAMIITLYDKMIKTSTQVQLNYQYFRGDYSIRLIDNYYIAKIEDRIHFLEFSALFQAISGANIFVGQSASFTATPSQTVTTRAYWQDKYGNKLSNSLTLELSNVSIRDEGAFVVNVFDQCQQQMQQSAQLVVYAEPFFLSTLNDVIVLCNDSTVVSTVVYGEQVQYSWTVDGALIPGNSSQVNITANNLNCESNHKLCAIATNPSGSSKLCSFLEVTSVDSVFNGPVPAFEQLLWFSESEVNLYVYLLLQPECTNHTWLKNGEYMGVYGATQSEITVYMSTQIEGTEFQVEALCIGNLVRSRPYKFKNVTSLTPLGLSLIIISIALIITVPIFVSIIYRRRLNRSKKQQIDLEMRLSQAKTESLRAKDNVTILQPTTWEWLPTDDYTYKPIEELPFAVDIAALNFSSKSAIEIDIFVQGDIMFSAKNTSKGVKMPLLGSNHQIDIYVPKSPKYEIVAEPSSFEISSRNPVQVTVSSKLRMTAKCNICLIVVCEQDRTYSAIEFKLESKPSMWLDIEEVQMTKEFLGGGGFGSVTRGVYRGQDVAVKKLLMQAVPEEIITEFEREVSLMKSLHHPNIVQFIGASNVQNNLSIVIEFAPLGSLASVVKKQRLSYNLKLVMLIETAKALQFLHSNGIVHRDIKPQNILVFSLEPKAAVHVKLTDFGTARFIPENATNVTRNIGTSGYMAPESLGKKPKIAKSADVYSFAILMWEVLFERVPFETMNWQSEIEEHVLAGQRLPFPSSPRVQPEIIQLIEECWQQDPSNRPTITSVAQRIASLL